MSTDKKIILVKAAKELNVSVATIVEHLAKKGVVIENKPTTKLSEEVFNTLLSDFQGDRTVKEEAKNVVIGKLRKEEPAASTTTKKSVDSEPEEEVLIKNIPVVKKSKSTSEEEDKSKSSPSVKVVGKIDLEKVSDKTRSSKKVKVEKSEEDTKEKGETSNKKSKKEVIKTSEEQDLIEEPHSEEKSVVLNEGKTEPLVEEIDEEVIKAKADKLTGPNVVGKIDLKDFEAKKKQPVPVASSSSAPSDLTGKKKRKRKESSSVPSNAQSSDHNKKTFSRDKGKGFKSKQSQHHTPKEEPSEKEIQDQIKATLARLSGAGKSTKFAQRAKLRRQKRDEIAASAEEAAMEQELQSKVLKVTEFVTANELANMMGVPVTQVISTCMSLGLFVSINQRLDAETLTIVADEFGYEVQFVTVTDDQEAGLDEVDQPEDLLTRAPIVTVMGHVDHGKTSLLDFIRKANVIAGEAGGITQHIGAYEVKLESGKKITFLDTPGHEAFTAMRARGAKVTDIVIIVIAADDSVMPQTKEAINHAMAAGVPIIFALNKIDKPEANADKIREQLASMNILVEEWGGKYQCQEISAKKGLNVDALLEKVLLEAELLDLKANPNKRATGTVIEAALDKGRGIVTTILVQAGTLEIGDPILAGCYSGKVKALFNERGQKIEKAGPSTPVQVLGMNGAPQAGDKFNAMPNEQEAREIATKRQQLQREQGIRTQKHITLDEIGRRLAIGNFKELNIIVKGDVDGSIEALADSLLKLSTEEIQINIIHKSVGQISESDVLLASASDAIIIGFQVRPSLNARKLAEQEQIDIRLYSIIYDAINEIKSAMEGMLSPEIEEKITANVEIREVFKITKVGTIAGCMVLDGKITRNSKVRIIRDGVVIYTGELASLKRFKDDVKEVAAGYECGLNIQNFNDIKEGDIVEAYEQVEVKRKLA